MVNTNYSENIDSTVKERQDYIDGLERLLAKRQKESADRRLEYTKDIFEEPDKYRKELREFLGWPLNTEKCADVPEVSLEKLAEEETHTIYRMRIKIFDELTLTGLFFKSVKEGKKPFILVQHGGGGTPERMSGIYGDTRNYNHLLERVIQYDVHAFAPQLLLWKKDEYGVEYDRKDIDVRLKRVGSSITAVELYALERVLDYFEKQDYVGNIGMTGLSYGGFFTLYLAALDTRIKSAVSCSYFNQRDKYPWTDWTWTGYADKFDDAEIACLIYPRHFVIEAGESDALFNIEYSRQAEKRLRMLCSKVGTQWYEYITFDGVHEYCKYDEPIENMIKDIL